VIKSELGSAPGTFSLPRLLHGVCALLAAAGRFDSCVTLLGFTEPRLDPSHAAVDAHASYEHLIEQARIATTQPRERLEVAGDTMAESQALEFALNEVQTIIASSRRTH
jgi:hypothetical protein